MVAFRQTVQDMFRSTVIALILLSLACCVRGHMGLTPSEAEIDEYVIVTLRIGHDCGDETIGTTNFTVVLPPDLPNVSVEQMSDWRIMIHKNTPDNHTEEAMSHHGSIRAVTYLGFLPDGFYQLFNLRIKTPSTPGEMIWFKGYQDCHNQGTSIAWDQIPNSTNPLPEYPARGIMLKRRIKGSHQH